MPRFDFQCKKCSAIFEESLPIGSMKKPTCPQCKSRSVEKLLAPPGIVFKGSGWYKTDSRTNDSEETKGTDGAKDAKGTEEKKTKKDDVSSTETKTADTKRVEKKEKK